MKLCSWLWVSALLCFSNAVFAQKLDSLTVRSLNSKYSLDTNVHWALSVGFGTALGDFAWSPEYQVNDKYSPGYADGLFTYQFSYDYTVREHIGYTMRFGFASLRMNNSIHSEALTSQLRTPVKIERSNYESLFFMIGPRFRVPYKRNAEFFLSPLGGLSTLYVDKGTLTTGGTGRPLSTYAGDGNFVWGITCGLYTAGNRKSRVGYLLEASYMNLGERRIRMTSRYQAGAQFFDYNAVGLYQISWISVQAGISIRLSNIRP